MEGEKTRDTIHSRTVRGHDDGARPLSASVAVRCHFQSRPTGSRPGMWPVIGWLCLPECQLFSLASDWLLEQ